MLALRSTQKRLEEALQCQLMIRLLSICCHRCNNNILTIDSCKMFARACVFVQVSLFVCSATKLNNTCRQHLVLPEEVLVQTENNSAATGPRLSFASQERSYISETSRTDAAGSHTRGREEDQRTANDAEGSIAPATVRLSYVLVVGASRSLVCVCLDRTRT